jgi:hypothetical protein
MMGTHELFTSLSEMDSDLHVELGTNAKCAVGGVGTVKFQLESGGSLEVANVLNLLSVSAMEDSGYTISFEDGWVLIRQRDLTDSTQVLGVREGKVYRLQGNLVGGSKGILDHGSMLVREDEEQEASKGEQSSQSSSVGSQPLDGKKVLALSSSVRGSSWYQLTLMDAQEQEEAPRSTLWESSPSTKFPKFMASVCSVINSVTSSV